jgi:hypothetical protein
MAFQPTNVSHLNWCFKQVMPFMSKIENDKNNFGYIIPKKSV